MRALRSRTGIVAGRRLAALCVTLQGPDPLTLPANGNALGLIGSRTRPADGRTRPGSNQAPHVDGVHRLGIQVLAGDTPANRHRSASITFDQGLVVPNVLDLDQTLKGTPYTLQLSFLPTTELAASSLVHRKHNCMETITSSSRLRRKAAAGETPARRGTRE